MTSIIESELIDLTRAYVALSNTHRLEFILPMFDENAIYYSTYVGEFRGRDGIANMMGDFFSSYADVHWEVEQYQYTSVDTVGFDFLMTATKLQDREQITRCAYEQLKFNQKGYIEYLEVKDP